MQHGRVSFNAGDQILVVGEEGGKLTYKNTDMAYMFRQASSFNQPIGGWVVDKVEETASVDVQDLT